MPENITPPPLGLEFYGKTFNNLGNSNTIAYKAYPRGWKFHGLYELFPGAVWDNLQPRSP
jgi:hypothetical protein